MTDTTDPREQLLDVISFTECCNAGTTPEALIAQVIAAEQHADLADAARWLVAMGYPFDWHGGQDTPAPPAGLREAVIDAVHEDRAGTLHGNTLTREQTIAWLDVEAPGFAPAKEG